MNAKTLLIVLLTIFVSIAAISSMPLVGNGNLLAVLGLFVGGFGAGVSARALFGVLKRQRERRPSKFRTDRSGGSKRERRPRERQRPERQRSDAGRRSGGKSKRLVGSVKWFDSGKGYGFLTVEGGNGQEECFVHRSSIQNGTSLTEGAQVEFEITTDDRGRRAAARVKAI